jgi:DNA-binding transcriptional MerR regulator
MMLKLSEAAKFLRIPKATLEHWVLRGYIPYHKENGFKLYDENELRKIDVFAIRQYTSGLKIIWSRRSSKSGRRKALLAQHKELAKPLLPSFFRDQN